MAFCPEHPKWDQNPKFTTLSETTSIPTPFMWESPREFSTLRTMSCNWRLVYTGDFCHHLNCATKIACVNVWKAMTFLWDHYSFGLEVLPWCYGVCTWRWKMSKTKQGHEAVLYRDSWIWILMQHHQNLNIHQDLFTYNNLQEHIDKNALGTILT